MQLYVKTLVGRTITVDFEPTTTILEVKRHIRNAGELPEQAQRLIFRGMQLEDGRTCQSYNIEREANLHLVYRLRGNGDMISNHVSHLVPARDARGVSILTSISISVDDTIRGLTQETALIQVRQGSTSGPQVAGTRGFNATTRTISFRPDGPLRHDTRYVVILGAEARVGQLRTREGEVVLNRLDWTFKTEAAKPLILHLQLQGQPWRTTLYRPTGPSAKGAFLALINTILHVPQEEIHQIQLIIGAGEEGGGPLPVLEDEGDFAALREGDRVRVLTPPGPLLLHLEGFGDYALRIPRGHLVGLTPLHQSRGGGELLRGSWRGRQVVVKRFQLRGDRRAVDWVTLRQELDAMGRLRHPCLMTAYGITELKGRPGLVVEYMPQMSLSQVLADTLPAMNQRWDLPTKLHVLWQIARGLEFLHHQDIVHKSLTSHAVLLDDHFNAKIGGYVPSVTDGSDNDRVRSVAWMAPESLQGEVVSKEANVYSFGVLMWECITRERPWADLQGRYWKGTRNEGEGRKRVATPHNPSAITMAFHNVPPFKKGGFYHRQIIHGAPYPVDGLPDQVAQIIGSVGFNDGRLAVPETAPEPLGEYTELCFEAPASRPTSTLLRQKLQEAYCCCQEDEGVLVEQTPREYVCPLRLRLMAEPVVAEDGVHYERGSLESWMNSVTVLRSPVTNQVMTQYKAYPSTNLTGLIRSFRREHYLDDFSSDEEEGDGEEGGR